MLLIDTLYTFVLVAKWNCTIGIDDRNGGVNANEWQAS